MTCPKCGHDPDAKVTASWSFFVEKRCHSLNSRIVNGGAKWQRARYRKERDEWFEWMRLAQRNNAIPVAAAKRQVRLLRVYTGRHHAFDVDGFVGGQKPVLDAMVLAGLIVGDNARWVDVEYVQRKGGPNERSGLWVFVEEVAVVVDALPPELHADALALHYQRKPGIR